MIARLLLALGVASGATLGALAYRSSGTEARRLRGHELDPRLDAVPEGPALLVFTSPLCIACRRTPGLVAQALGVGEDELRAGEAPVALAELDVRDHGDLASRLDVTRTPTLVGLDATGTLAFAHAGNPEPEALADQLARLREAAP